MHEPRSTSGRTAFSLFLLAALLILSIGTIAIVSLEHRSPTEAPKLGASGVAAPRPSDQVQESPANIETQGESPGEPQAQRAQPSDSDMPPASLVSGAKDEGRLNILLLGVDQRPGEDVPSRSDSIIVVSVNRHENDVTMISLPRDMWVEIPGFGHNRINAATAFGDANGYPGGGPALAAKTVEHNFELKVDRHARVNFQGFQAVVDALGGVTVVVERPVPLLDHETFTGEDGVTTSYIPPGKHQMDGRIALQYARSRLGEDDFARAERQQRLLLAILERATRLDTVPKLPALIPALRDTVDTDIPPQDLLQMLALARSLDRKNIRRLVVGRDLTTPFVGEGGMQLLRPDIPGIKMAIADILTR